MTAAAARKLQKDMDITVKKVDDGIDEFATVWEQAASATSAAQKDKLGEELKRSINKLQRLRAQIREWISQADIKSNCKDKLEDARRRIEADMQRFKDFERELKTKAFSTCALARADELDLEEAERKQYQEWLISTLQTLGEQLEEIEADIEALSSKKNLNSDAKANLANLKVQQERHQWHTKKLELILRALDNEAIDMSDLAIVRDSIEVYLEHYNEPEFPHDETMYDCFELTEFEDKQVVAKPGTAVVPEEKEEIVAQKEEPQKKGKEKEKRKKEDKKDKKREEREKAKALHQEKKTLDDINPEEIKVQEDQLLSEAEEFICKICQIHVVGCSPKLTSCSHLFCGDCLAQWFSQHPDIQTWAQRAKSAGPERIVPCPVCKQPLNEKKDLYPVCGSTQRSENLLLWRMLSALKIMCVNHHKIRPDGKCDWIGEYGQYQKHALSCSNHPGDGSAGADDKTSRSDSLSQAPSTSTAQPTPDSKASADLSIAKELLSSAREEPVQAKAAPPVSQPAPVQSKPKQAAPPVSQPAPTQSKPKQAPAEAEAKHAPSIPTAPKAAPVVTVPAKAPPVTAHVPAAAAQAPAPAQTPAYHQNAPPVTAHVPPAAAQAPAPAQTPAFQSAATAPSPAYQDPTPAPTPSYQPVAPAQTPAYQSSAPAATPAYQSTTPAPAPAAAPVTTPTQTAAAAQQAAVATPTAIQQEEVQQPEITPGLKKGDVCKARSAFEPTNPQAIAVNLHDTIVFHDKHASGWILCTNNTTGQEGWAPEWVIRPTEPIPAPVAAAQPTVQEHQHVQQAYHTLQQAYAQQAMQHQMQQAAMEMNSMRDMSQPFGGMDRMDHMGVHHNVMKQHQAAGASRMLASYAGHPSGPLHHQAAAHQHAAQLGYPGVHYATSGHNIVDRALRPDPQAAVAQAAPQSRPKVYRPATAVFVARTDEQMSLNVSDLVEIVERNESGWTFGRKDPSNGRDSSQIIEGWFPDWVCPQK